MRRAICLFLVILFAATTPSPAFAADDDSYVDGCLEAEFSDAIGSTENFSTMIANDTAYDASLKNHQGAVFGALQIDSQDPSSSGDQRPTDADKVLLSVNQYDENGELVEAIHFDYDKDGLISRSYHDSYRNGVQNDWGYDYIYTYDEEGRLISRYYYVDMC